jgi:hypothetical protein
MAGLKLFPPGTLGDSAMELRHMKILATALEPALNEAGQLLRELDACILAKDCNAVLLPGSVLGIGLDIVWPLAIASEEVMSCESWFSQVPSTNRLRLSSYYVGLKMWNTPDEASPLVSLFVKVDEGDSVLTWRRLRQLLDAFDWPLAPNDRVWNRRMELECSRLPLDNELDLELVASALLEVANKLYKALTARDQA